MQYSTRGNPLIGLLFLFLFLFLGFYFIKGMFFLLQWVAPVLFILTLIINYRVVMDYGRWLYRLIIDRPFWGVLYTLMTFVGFPFVVGFLFLKALGGKYVRQLEQRIAEDREGRVTDYEVVDTEFITDEEYEIEDGDSSGVDFKLD